MRLLPRIRQKLGAAYVRMVLRIAEKRTLAGVQVGVFLSADESHDTYFRVVEDALEMLASRHPCAFARLLRHVPTILVAGHERHRVAHWQGGARVCVVTQCYLDSKPILESIASTLVHETVHARMWSIGIGYPEGSRCRIEVLCAKAELEFAKRLGDRQLIELAERRVDSWRRGGEAPWSDKEFRRKALRHLADAVVPRKLLRLLSVNRGGRAA